MSAAPGDAPVRFGPAGLDQVIGSLRADGYEVLAPVRRDDALEIDAIDGVDDLPLGWGDEQTPGHYRLRRRHDGARFGYATTATGWKRAAHPPRAPVWRAERVDGRVRFVAGDPPAGRQAWFGVRPCELAGLERLGHVLAAGETPDPVFVARRGAALVVAVACASPAGTCFCTSMGTGPGVPPDGGGADLSLVEVVDGDAAWYLATAHTAAGAEALAGIGERATAADGLAAHETVARAATGMTRQLDVDGLPAMIAEARRDDDRWRALGERCLACGSCTAVCPTCFCTTVVDGGALDGSTTWRDRTWDTCFSLEFTHVVAGPTRHTMAARYRHWFTHKLSAWHDQYGESGCVGCGRCTTWCPVGIDLLAEASAVRAGGPS